MSDTTFTNGVTLSDADWFNDVNRLHYTLLQDPNAAYYLCNGRLTLTSGTPVTSADVTAAGTIYFTPYGGSKLALYDGSTNWKAYNFTELSLALTLTSGKPYDVFVYDNSGTPTLETLVWTNDTTRATALTLQNGVYVKTGATTRRYLGTIYASGANTTEDSDAKRYVWNYYHRVTKSARVVDTTNSWSYSTATFQQANAAATNQLDYVCGVLEDAISASVIHSALNSTASLRNVYTGIGIDSTTVNSALSGVTSVDNGSAKILSAQYAGFPGVGRHKIVWLEAGAGTDVQTWFGDNGAALMQTGITGLVRC